MAGSRMRAPRYNVWAAERYRSGRNGGASKASCRVSGTGVRIPPSPPIFARSSRRDCPAESVWPPETLFPFLPP
jgi:hypothetical protein